VKGSVVSAIGIYRHSDASVPKRLVECCCLVMTIYAA